MDLQYHRDVCKKMFGLTTLPDVNATNNFYGRLTLRLISGFLGMLVMMMSASLHHVDLVPPWLTFDTCFFAFLGTGGVNFAGSNVFFSNGVADPWQWASIRHQ